MIQFHIDGNTLPDIMTWEDIETLETRNQLGMRPLMARFVVDDKAQPVPFEQAMKMLGNLPARQINENIDSFIRLFQELTINPTTGDGSSTPSPKVEQPLSGGSSSLPPATGDASPGS